MIERPFDQVYALFKDNNQKNKDLLKYVFEKSDGISLWVMGLSVGALSLLFTNILNIKKLIPAANLSFLVWSLSISVISGIIYRVLFLYWFVLQNRIGDQIDIAFTREKKMHQVSLLNGNETFQQLVFLVQDSTGIDYSHLIPLFNESDEENKKILYDSLVGHYLKNIEFAKEDLKLAVDSAIEIFAKAGATNKDKFLKKALSTNTGLHARRVSHFVRFFYIIFNLAFLIAICVFAISIK
jgi:hypothetical protein